jgi:hypothetical protein
MVNVYESSPDRTIDTFKIEAAGFADCSVDFNTVRTIDVASFVTIDLYPEAASLLQPRS